MRFGSLWSGILWIGRADMTNRALPLEIRGFSRGSFDGSVHPLPERPQESVPLSYLDTVWELKGLTNSYYTPDTSSHSSPTSDNTVGINNIFSLSNSWSTYTGNLTGRSSSAYSWGNDDEFDRQAAATVKHMFDEIDEKLFEGKAFNGSDQLLSECEEWCSRFPHLRIFGVQIVPALDDGTQVVPLPPDDPRTCSQRPPTSFLEDVEDNLVLESQGLFVRGVHVQPFPMDLSGSCLLQNGNEYSEFEEEVFAEDGQVEEYFAYDSPGPDDGPRYEAKRIRAKLRRHVKLGLPPLTPNACARDAIASEMFDQIWSEVVVWLRNLLSLYSQKLLRDKPHLREVVRTRDRVIESPSRPVSRHLPSQLHRGTSGLCVKGLEDVMMIKPFTLQHRAPSVTAIHLGDRAETPFTPARPGSSSTVLVRARRYTSAIKNKNAVRLPPLDTPKTPNETVSGAFVQGTKLTTGNERLSTPPHTGNSNSPQSWVRNGTLLPLERDNPYHEHFPGSYPSRSSAKNRVHFKPQNRASSAATDDSRRSLRDKTSMNSDARPNTTHTFRTDPPAHFRRMSIPMRDGLSSRGLGPSRQPLDLMAGIMGVSMVINNPLVEAQASHSSTQLQSHDTRGISPASDDTDDIEIDYDHGHTLSTHSLSRKTRLGTSIR